ncbi:MAG: T9SS type A sorting domain-containing protein [Lentimicrobiaceae bacterium]|nr:T9SS type A sorting domain-containing protein [Lentimicrobiaceae bacterium]
MRKFYFVTKILLLVLFLQFAVNQDLYAQKDSFFTYNNNEYYRNVDDITAPGLPYSHGLSEDYQLEAPLGNGLLALSLLGAGYLVKKSRKNRNKKNNIKIIILGMMILGHGFSAEAQNFYFPKPADNFDGNNMTVYGQLKIDGEFADENIEIGAFCGDEVRGRAFIIKQGSTYLFFLTLYGNTNDVINLKFYDHSVETELNVGGDYSITFSSSSTDLNAGAVNYYTIKYKFIGTDKDWNKVSNWQLVCDSWAEPQNATQLPSSNPKMIDDIIVAANLDATSDYIVKDLEIISEKVLTIAPSASLEIIGDIANDDVNALVVNSDINGTGSLIHNDDNVVAKVNCYFDNSSVTREWNADWHFISSPVANQTIESFIPTEENYDFYSWSEFNSTWYNQKKDDSQTNEFYTDNGFDFAKGRGYLVAYENEGYKKFSGTLNNGDVTYPLSCSTDGEFVTEKYTGFNLLGNPYPSYIDWEAEGWTRDNLQLQTIWIYDDDVNNYITYTLGGVATNGGSQYIAPCQAFFVKAASAGNIIMTNDIRTNEKSSFRKNDNENIFKVRVNGVSGQDEIAVVKGDNDDVFKMFSLNDDAPSLYINKGVGDYSVVYIDDENTLPLSFEGGFAKYTISLSECGNAFDEIILEDRMTGEKVNLMTESYSFIYNDNDRKDRFVLTFDNSQQTTDNDYFAYINNGEIIINDINGDAQIEIYDLMGRRVYENADAVSNVSTYGYSSGVYIIRKIDDEGIKTQKILLNN